MTDVAANAAEDVVHAALPGAPTSAKERIALLDVTRGIAVLGILIMNIIVFGAPYALLTDPTFMGDMSGADYVSWFVTSTLFEGSFRTIFGMLFGAGIYLFFTRLEERSGQSQARALHFRRSFWLILFGLVDAYLLLWVGDILFLYGLMGLLLWMFRKMGNVGLTIWIIVFALISLFLKFGNAFSTDLALNAIAEHEAALAAGESVSEEDAALVEDFRKQIAFTHPEPEQRDAEIASVASGYAGASEVYHKVAFFLQTKAILFFMIWDSFIAMLLGLMLFKNGVLTGEARPRTYALLALAGYAIALPLRMVHLGDYAAADFDLSLFTWNQMWYDLERVGAALGHIGLIALLLKGGILPLASRFAAVGQMALSNYLMQSVIGLVLFVLLGLYGTMDRVTLYGVMIAIWIAQLIYSPIWLKHFRFGPMEWLWRSLTYWSLQPLKR